MDLAGDLPVTLVIKAPNQRIEDQTVDCMLGWTVKKLKEHLKSVYPNRPSEKHQKLIYSGKLLADHLTLKDVLRQFDDGSNKHTVHLVCTSPFSQTKSTEKESPIRLQSSISSSATSPSNNTEPVTSPAGLRFRGNNTSSQSTQQQPFVNQVNPNVFSVYNYGGQFPQMPQFPAGFPPEAAAAMYGGVPQGSGMTYTPEQYMWMQQAYAQYMSQYMQYYQQAGYPIQGNIQGVPSTAEGNAENRNVENNNRQEAQANADNFDDDEEFGQRDWLDYLYYFSRLMVLLGIVYFYSNVTRFLMVAVFFFVVYLYQMGWLGFAPRRRNEHNQQAQQEQQQPAQQQQPPPEEAQPEQQAQPEQIENADTSNTDTTDAQPVAPEPRGPGPLKITWTLISTFFTSLFPAPPPPVNVN